MNEPTIGLMMVVRNEIKRLPDCLEYHVPFVDEVVIVDQESDDGTFDYLLDFQKKLKKPMIIINDKKWGYCEPSKQKAADEMMSDWILYIDPDEKFAEVFLRNMHELVKNEKYTGYNLPRYNWFDVQVFDDNVPIEPKWLTIRHPKKDPQLRLTKKSASTFLPFLHHRPRIEGVAYDLPYPIQHKKTIMEQWEDNKRYDIINKK